MFSISFHFPLTRGKSASFDAPAAIYLLLSFGFIALARLRNLPERRNNSMYRSRFQAMVRAPHYEPRNPYRRANDPANY
jgi:hypothetical protein